MAAAASWVNLDTTAQAGNGQKAGLFDGSGWVVNIGGRGGVSTGAVLPKLEPWMVIVVAALALAWLLRKN